MIIGVLNQSYNKPPYAYVRITNKDTGEEVGLMAINQGTYWNTPTYPDGNYIVKVLEVDPDTKLDYDVMCEVRAQDAMIGVYFDHDDKVRICAASQRDYA